MGPSRKIAHAQSSRPPHHITSGAPRRRCAGSAAAAPPTAAKRRRAARHRMQAEAPSGAPPRKRILTQPSSNPLPPFPPAHPPTCTNTTCARREWYRILPAAVLAVSAVVQQCLECIRHDDQHSIAVAGSRQAGPVATAPAAPTPASFNNTDTPPSRAHTHADPHTHRTRQ